MSALPIVAASGDAAAGAAAFVAGLSLLLIICGFVLAIVWLIFPFVVISKCSEIASLAKDIRNERRSHGHHVSRRVTGVPGRA